VEETAYLRGPVGTEERTGSFEGRNTQKGKECKFVTKKKQLH